MLLLKNRIKAYSQRLNNTICHIVIVEFGNEQVNAAIISVTHSKAQGPLEFCLATLSVLTFHSLVCLCLQLHKIPRRLPITLKAKGAISSY